MQLISKTDNRPYMNVIFGNFYSPAFDNEEFVDKTMGLIRDLGFNSVMFDTKAWEDFKEIAAYINMFHVFYIIYINLIVSKIYF